MRSTWSAKIQHAAPVSALLVRALERCAHRDDTRLSRVVIDLMGGVPAEGDFWVARADRAGRQADRVGQRRDAWPSAPTDPARSRKASGWRMQTLDTQALVHAPAPPLRPLSEARSRDMAKDWDRNYVHSVDWRWLTVTA